MIIIGERVIGDQYIVAMRAFQKKCEIFLSLPIFDGFISQYIEEDQKEKHQVAQLTKHTTDYYNTVPISQFTDLRSSTNIFYCSSKSVYASIRF